jgi:hypothetical protein
VYGCDGRNTADVDLVDAEVESLRPVVRVPARSALFVGAAAARVPLAVTAPDSAPILAYDRLAERITEVIAR